MSRAFFLFAIVLSLGCSASFRGEHGTPDHSLGVLPRRCHPGAAWQCTGPSLASTSTPGAAFAVNEVPR